MSVHCFYQKEIMIIILFNVFIHEWFHLLEYFIYEVVYSDN